VFLTGMFSLEENIDRTDRMVGEGFANDFLSWYGTSQAVKQFIYPSNIQTDVVSFMFRANYTFDARFPVTFTLRHDGASVFGEDNKWGTFMSGSAAWNVHNETFFKNSFLGSVFNNLKLRLSYGSNGNMAIKPYQTIAQMDNSYPFNSDETLDYVDAGAPTPGFVPSTLATPSLSWETTDALNFGFDFGLFGNRINGDFNIYRNTTRDLLLERKITSVHGMSRVYQNVGKTQNQGIELVLNSTNISGKDFSWSSGITFSYNQCKILELPDGDDTVNRWFIGQPIRVNFDYYIVGTWQENEAALASLFGAQPGYAKYDKRGDNPNQIGYDDSDRQIIGSPDPSTLIGLTNTFTYKDFSLSVFLYAALGGVKSNQFYNNSSNSGVWRDWWSPSNPTNKMWSPITAANAYVTGGGGGSTRPSKFEKTDFLRVKDVTLGYNLPKKYVEVIGLSNLNVYVSVRNLLTVTNYGGLDPELADNRNTPLNREYMFGLKFSF